jgi:mannose/cellobiose epimerase-like protein (N-acyl-D-glucosamine 2-epimerase family)
MENISINLARDLPASARSAVENLLGRSLRDDEEVSVMALDPHPAPSGEARWASADRLRSALDQLALKAQNVANGEVDEAVDEAMNHIRPRRT